MSGTHIRQHAGHVASRVDQKCLIQDPITIVIEGVATNLSLQDAETLQEGLADAIDRIKQNDLSLRVNDSLLSHSIIIGTFPHLSRLG